MKGKYMAYVGSYSYNGKAKGITVFDVDVAKGVFRKRCEVEVDNSSYLTASHDGKFLYSIADEGVVSFRILENGSIQRLNKGSIRGMRGCFLTTDKDDKFLFVAGYHDGKATVVHINKDGTVGNVASGVFHKGLGSVAERNFRPHVSCVRLSPEGKFLFVADLGIDQVKIYRFDHNDGKIILVDSLRRELESAPRNFMFSSDGRFMYLMSELKNVIEVFSYETGDRVPKLELLESTSTAGRDHSQMTAACSIQFSPDESHLFCSNAGDNSVSIYKRDAESGLLEQICCLPISGDYPKDVAVFPDGKHIASINHETGSISFFKVDYKKGLLIMNANPVEINEPNCCVMVRVTN